MVTSLTPSHDQAQPAPTERAFYERATVQYNDALAYVQRNRALWRTIAIIFAVALALSAVALLVLAVALASKHDDVYALVIDHNRYGRDAAVVALPRIDQPGSDGATAREAAVDYYLPLVVESLFSVDPEAQNDKANLVRFVRPFVAPNSQAATIFAGYLSSADPVQRGQSIKVTVDVAPIAPATRPNEYQVTWTTTTTDLDGSATCPQLHCGKTTYSARVNVAWGKATPRFNTAPDGTTYGGNPVGMFITGFFPSRSLDPNNVGTQGQ